MNDIDFSVVLPALPYLWSGLTFSLALTAAAFVIGMILGTALALVQHLDVPGASHFARGYVTLMRSVPLILVLFWFFFLVPIILGFLNGTGRPVPIGATYTAFITFGMFEAAYYSEIIRVGLRSLQRGQYEAAMALSLSTWKTYRLIILPQVFRVVAPIILSQTIILFQDTSLVYVLSLTDLLGAASKVGQLNGRLVELYLTVAVVYLVICLAASQIVAGLRSRTALKTR
ncbi:putative ABC transporter permease protein (plasmid) [Sinorhizobium fredii HH103]|uniref:Glutamate/aspartate import permease protein GltK n=1 Tax=Sinorhizobium fredii (strain HH103) TaxID=1117943 RepID=G9AIT1_SINF1|nr:ABC transporter permease subunit [Sinorhizobium fredii]CCF00963.1 putative ABC transporter permease protein [Sinorhizobium fredii HH103]